MNKFLNKHSRSQIGLNFVLNELQLLTPFGKDILKRYSLMTALKKICWKESY